MEILRNKLKTNDMKRILLIAMIMACAAASAQVKRGDVNNDNSVNTADVVEIYNIIINGDKKIVTGVARWPT